MPTYWIMSGEASGDLYGAGLAQAIRARCPEAIIRGMGGPQMKAAGVDIMVDSTELGIIGLWEALRHLPFFIRLRRTLARRAAEERPDTVVMIDYPGFNLSLASQLHKSGIRVVWYISPQVWAWRTGRIWKLAKYCARMLCIFPFEPPYYAPTTLKAEFIGHPLVAQLAPYRRCEEERQAATVLLLPGSRRQELRRLLQPMLETAALLHRRNPALHFEIAFPRQAIADYADELMAQMRLPDGMPEIKRFCGETRERMAVATAALAASGTVTVEAALLGLPVVVTYKVNALTYLLGRLVLKIDTITIANLVCKRKVFEEFIQGDCNAETLGRAMEAILPGGARREACLAGIREFTESLGAGGDVAANAAAAVLEPENDGK